MNRRTLLKSIGGLFAGFAAGDALSIEGHGAGSPKPVTSTVGPLVRVSSLKDDSGYSELYNTFKASLDGVVIQESGWILTVDEVEGYIVELKYDDHYMERICRYGNYRVVGITTDERIEHDKVFKERMSSMPSTDFVLGVGASTL